MHRFNPTPVTDGDRWRAIGRVAAAHVVMLREVGVIDDDALAALAVAIDAAARGTPPAGATLAELAVAFDERVDAVARAEEATVVALGREVADTVATAVRLLARERLLALVAATNAAREALIALGAAHAVTLMPAFAAGQVAQPTTLAHALGATLGPLGRTVGRLRAAHADLNRSPLGAGTVASTAVEIDRERAAALLGCDGPIAGTFDAVAAVDDLVAAGQAAGAVAATGRRWLGELLAWLRADPTAFRLGDDWLGGEPGLPHLAAPVGLLRLVETARQAEAAADALRQLAAEAALTPITHAADALLDRLVAALDGATATSHGLRALAAGGLDVNRAYLANRAGRGYATAGDIALFLMTEEGLDPASARAIGALVVARLREQGLEITGITPESIDLAAMMVVGRELKVELEAIGRYLAPRRFIERRTATGGPAPLATRAQLDAERFRLDADARWTAETAARQAAALAGLDRQLEEAAALAGT